MLIDVTPGGAFTGRDHGAGFYLGSHLSRRHPFYGASCPSSRQKVPVEGVSLRDKCSGSENKCAVKNMRGGKRYD